jgi:1,4-alpha-glucan branching enzyme
MGALPFDGGTTFRVWAPHATAVFVTGDFNDWHSDAIALAVDPDDPTGTWSADVADVRPGAEYRFLIRTPEADLWRLDPHARQVTSSIGNAVVYDPDAFDWGDEPVQMPGWDDIVIYEMHIGTFAASARHHGTFDRAIGRLPHLRELGVGAIQVMPPFEFAGDISWGYNPAHPFAIESGYGGPDAFKRFIKAAHDVGIAVIVDVVYNHLGPSDLDLWRFDGWHEGEWGGIYFYNDTRAETPWGSTRPDYGRGEVRRYLRDNALTWLEEFRCDGLRFDSTKHVRAVDGEPANRESHLSDGWSFMAWLNDEIRLRQPWKLSIAEDLALDPAIVAPTDEGGAGFTAQWDAGFVHPIRAALTESDDEARDLDAVVAAITGEGRGPALTRVIYTESHDEVANGKRRVPEEISPGDAGSWWSRKRAAIGSALVLTSPGIPMLFQGQELLEDRWFEDTTPLDWSKADLNDGVLRLHRDLIRLRRDTDGVSAGLRGDHVAILHLDHDAKVLAFHRWASGGPGDDVVVVANFANRPVDDVRVGMPRGGRWRVRLNSDSHDYDEGFGGHAALDTEADGPPDGDSAQSALVSVGPYSVVILSQDP